MPHWRTTIPLTDGTAPCPLQRSTQPGDTIWNKHVETAIEKHKPDVIVLNIGNAVFMGYDPIVMGLEDAVAVHNAAPNAMLVASHMEAINHCILSRATLRDFSVRKGFEKSLLIPADGETESV